MSRTAPPHRCRYVAGMRRLLLLAAACAALAFPAAAAAGPGLLLGIDDDLGKWDGNSPVAGAISDLGATVQRITVVWLPGEGDISGIEAENVQSAIDRAPNARTVLAVYGRRPTDAPQTPAARTEFCTFVRGLLQHYPSIRDVVIWNEVNRAEFWWPQQGAPAKYEALLARCYDLLHALRPNVNVISSTAARGDARGTDAGDFVRALGQAYRSSRRTAPIVDTFGHNPYPAYSAEKPWARHPAGGSLSEGDYPALMQAYYDGFAGTGQPLPGQAQTTVWYLEDGFQTAVDPSLGYTGTETDLRTLSAADQATQLVDAVRLAYCEPAVGAFFNFLLVDERDLGGWQSGLMWASLQPKPSYDAFKQVAREVASSAVDCAHLSGGPAPAFTPATTVAVNSVQWAPNEVRIDTGEPAVYQADLLDGSGHAVAGLSGSVGSGAAVLRFPAVVAPGSYRIRLRLSAAYAPARTTTLVGTAFRIARAQKPKAKPPVFVVVSG
jgi:hypothetical protein